MNDPIFEPHFSAEHLSRKIQYLKNKMKGLPKGKIILRDNLEYVRIYGNKEISTFEKRTNTPEGRVLAEQVREYQITKKEYDKVSAEFKKYYPRLIPEKQEEIQRYMPIPHCMSLNYYDNPPDIRNTAVIDTPYIFEDMILRSRFELIAAQTFKAMGISFKYDIPIQTENGIYFLDMLVPVPERGRCVGFEFCGKFGDSKYMNNLSTKIVSYSGIGLIPYHDVIFVFGGKTWLPHINEIKRAIIFGIENC